MATDILPPWLRTRLLNEASRERYTGFLPDQSAFDEALDAQVETYLQQLPIAQEQFNADLASRGIYGAGQAPQEMYRTVMAPVATGIAAEVGRSRLDYSKMLGSSRIASEQFYQSAVDRLLQAVMSNDAARLQQGFDWTSLFRSAAQVGAAYFTQGASAAV